MKKYIDRIFCDKKIRIHKLSADRELWLPFDDSASGALLMANKNVLNFYSNQIDEGVKKIIAFKPERLVLAYNYLNDDTIWNYMTFFTAWWQHKEKINCELFIYVPDKSSVGNNIFDELKKKNFKRFTFAETDPVKFPDWKIFLNDEPRTTMPMWNFDADEFDFFAFYEFLCKRLSYIEKRMRLFPQLESGMSYGNLLNWLDAREQDFIFRVSFCRESMLGTDSTRLWKLLEQKSIEAVMRNIKWNKLSNGNIFYQLTCADLNYILDDRLPKNALAKEIFQNDIGKPYSFLFPMPLFLGYYAQMGNIGSYIPEYNFHEIIDALCKILQNEPCPELLPDIPDEPEISLEAYRNGYIKLAPRCTRYYEKDENIVAEFMSRDDACDFADILEDLWRKGCSILKGMDIFESESRIVFKDIVDRAKLFELLKKAASVCPEYKINMMLWDGGTLRKMTVQEILLDSAERILHHFNAHSKDALEYLHHLHEQFKDKFKRFSVVE